MEGTDRARLAVALMALLMLPAAARAAATEFPTPSQPSSPDGIIEGPDGDP